MKEILRILMERDGLDEKEAIYLILDTRQEILEAIGCGDFDAVEDIMYDNLGLEMDYVEAFIF